MYAKKFKEGFKLTFIYFFILLNFLKIVKALDVCITVKKQHNGMEYAQKHRIPMFSICELGLLTISQF